MLHKFEPIIIYHKIDQIFMIYNFKSFIKHLNYLFNYHIFFYSILTF